MNKDRWIFYTDLFGGQRWEKLGGDGLTLAESAIGFSTLGDALADAARAGYRPGAACASGVLEWRCEAVASVEDAEDSAA